jgi:hypothetical protein
MSIEVIFKMFFLLNWRLTVHIILYMLLLLAQPLEEKVRKKHYRGLLKDNLVVGLMELLVVEALTPLL